MNRVLGYCDRWSVAPGETVRFMVSCIGGDRYDAAIVRLRQPDAGPQATPFAPEPVAAPCNGSHSGRLQSIPVGSLAVVPPHAVFGAASFTLVTYLWPTTPAKGRQAIMGTWTEATETGEEIACDISFLKGYTVFNAEQIDGLPPHFTAPATPTLDPVKRIERAETFFANLNADIRYGGDRAFYAPGPDRIQMPPFEAFRDAESFYGTLAHECCHWSGAKSRLNRDLSGRFGSHAYATDELVSEICSAFLCADLGLTPEPREDHASYIETWLRVLKSDKRAIFTAAAHAERAAAFLHLLQPKAEAADEPNAESAMAQAAPAQPNYMP